MAVDARGHVYVADTGNDRIEKFASDGEFLRSWGIAADRHTAPDLDPQRRRGRLPRPRLRRRHRQPPDRGVHDGGRFLRVWGHGGSGHGEFHHARAPSRSTHGPVYVADTDNSRIEKFTSDGRFLAPGGARARAAASSITQRRRGRRPRPRLRRRHRQRPDREVHEHGQFLRSWGSGTGPGQFKHPRGVAVDASGNVYVADTGNDRIEKFSQP